MSFAKRRSTFGRPLKRCLLWRFRSCWRAEAQIHTYQSPREIRSLPGTAHTNEEQMCKRLEPSHQPSPRKMKPCVQIRTCCIQCCHLRALRFHSLESSTGMKPGQTDSNHKDPDKPPLPKEDEIEHSMMGSRRHERKAGPGIVLSSSSKVLAAREFGWFRITENS